MPLSRTRYVAATLSLLTALLSGCAGAPTSGQQQALVDRATLSVQEMLLNGRDTMNAGAMLKRARAVIVCPQVFRGGFFLGAEGGNCVIAGRDAAGSWSSPAFYALSSGTFGLQAGIQDMQILMLIMNERALTAVLDSQVKVGADAGLAIATLGGSVEGATTSAVGADIVAFAQARGLYAGLTLEGTLLSAKSDWNRGYYGKDVDARQVIIAMDAYNPGADPLRAMLMRAGTGGPSQVAVDRPPPAIQAAPRGMVAQETLPGIAPSASARRPLRTR